MKSKQEFLRQEMQDCISACSRPQHLQAGDSCLGPENPTDLGTHRVLLIRLGENCPGIQGALKALGPGLS